VGFGCDGNSGGRIGNDISGGGGVGVVCCSLNGGWFSSLEVFWFAMSVGGSIGRWSGCFGGR